MKLFEVTQPLTVDFSGEKVFRSDVKIDNNLKISNRKPPEKIIILNTINNFKKNVNGDFSIGLGGNCGKFALGLSEILKRINILTTIAISFRNVEDIQIYTVNDIIAAETDIYHVIIVDSRNNYYDASGATSIAHLQKLANEEYDDDEPGFMDGISPTDNKLKILINNDTNWSEDEDYFLKLFKTSKK